MSCVFEDREKTKGVAMDHLSAVIGQILRTGETIDVESLIHPPERPPRAVSSAALLDVLIRLAGPAADGSEVLGQLLQEAQRRGWPVPEAGASATPTEGEGIWVSPDDFDVQHGQVWTVKTRGGAVIRLAQLDGYDTRAGRQVWRAINLETRRLVVVRAILHGSCPRLGGRRERAKR